MALNFPSSPTQGQVYDNYFYDFTMQAWRAVGSVVEPQIPTGVISQFAGLTAPGGYLRCIGQSVLTEDYPILFSVIGYRYGGSGTNFSIPDLQSRVAVGQASAGTFATLSNTGGSETHTLSSTEIPAHSHANTLGSNTVASSTHTHDRGTYAAAIGATANNIAAIGYVAGNTVAGGPTTSTYGITGPTAGGQSFNHYTPVYGVSGLPSATTTVTISNVNNAGGGTSHNNLQPYIVLNYIIKT